MVKNVYSPPKIVNIKFSFAVSKAKCDVKKKLQELEDWISVKHHCNYSVLRAEKPGCVFIIFHTGFVNCTGTPDHANIHESVRLFCTLFSIHRRDIGRFRIDNISATAHLGHCITLRTLNSNEDCIRQVLYNPERFAGAHIKITEGGCCIVFANGKIVIVGAKTQAHMNRMFAAAKHVVHSSKLDGNI